MGKSKTCRRCRKAPPLRLKEVCGICELVEDGRGVVPGGHSSAVWPAKSISLAVGTNPKELAAAREIDRKAGVKTEYDAKGRPIFTDATHKKRYVKAHEAYDYDSW